MITFRIPMMQREKAAIVKLRRFGYRINHLAKAFGRSTSIIHHILAANYNLVLHRTDFRKIPRHVKLFQSRKRMAELALWMPFWETWILSDEGKPP